MPVLRFARLLQMRGGRPPSRTWRRRSTSSRGPRSRGSGGRRARGEPCRRVQGRAWKRDKPRCLSDSPWAIKSRLIYHAHFDIQFPTRVPNSPRRPHTARAACPSVQMLRSRRRETRGPCCRSCGDTRRSVPARTSPRTNASLCQASRTCRWSLPNATLLPRVSRSPGAGWLPVGSPRVCGSGSGRRGCTPLLLPSRLYGAAGGGGPLGPSTPCEKNGRRGWQRRRRGGQRR